MGNVIKTSFYELESLNPQIASIYPEKDNFEENKDYLILDFGRKTKQDITECNIRVKLQEDLLIYSTTASCGCTRPTFKKVDDYYIVHVYFNNKEVVENVSKYFTIHINNSKKIKFNLIINKR